MQGNNLGFKIKKILPGVNWKVLEITPDIKLTRNFYCPSDKALLQTVCTLIGRGDLNRLRIGACRSCGYVGYIDRPTRKWLSKFYSSIWDYDAFKYKRIAEEIAAHKNSEKKSHRRKFNEMSRLIKNLAIDKSRFICEVGCGTGRNLKQLESLGFANLLGIENSRHRAKIATQAYGLKILTAPFEDSANQPELERHSPFSLVFSHHVIEHTFDPNEIIKASSRLQNNGDYIIHSLPNLAGEASLAVLLFLPHLHAFTHESFKRLLEANSYEIIDTSLTGEKELYFLARKVEYTRHTSDKSVDYYESAIQKFSKFFNFNQMQKGNFRLIECCKKEDACQNSPLASLDCVKKLISAVIRPSNRQRLIIAPIKKKLIPISESPIEIQFNGRIKLFYK